MSEIGPPALSAHTRRWMITTAALTALPHLPYVEPWLGAFAILTLLWQGWAMHRQQPTPRRWLIALFAVGAAAGVLLGYQTLFGKQAGIALLVILLTLKLLESHQRRDVTVFVFLAFFLQLGLFLDTESALTAIGALVGAWSATVALLSASGERHTRRGMRTGGLLLVQSIPFMVAMFIIFPRIPGPLWGLPKDAFAGRTGLSDTMAPGSISSLIQSGEVAFRVRFTAAPPPPAQRYWRGPVLTDFDGRQWSPRESRVMVRPEYTVQGPRVEYTLVLEPHNKHWLLGLDYPAPGIENSIYSRDLRLLKAQPVTKRLRMELAAYPEARVGLSESLASRRAALALPEQFNPRTVALGRQLARDGGNPEAIVGRALTWLREAGLQYTLSPPRLGRDTADEFLFETRQGFCEHFSSAFTVLMRAAGVPTRIVTGYQGGELNPFDQFMVVRQSDAHAWSEVWIEGRGWVRVDPTAAANPVRISQGSASALSQDAAAPFMLRPDLEWLRGLRQRWDFVNNTWNQWVLGYDENKQRDLLGRLGLNPSDWIQMSAILTMLSLAFAGALLIWTYRKAGVSDPVVRQWRRFERKLAQKGISRLPSEGPGDYAVRAGKTYASQRAHIMDIARTYARMHYGPGQPGKTDVAEFKSMIDRLKL